MSPKTKDWHFLMLPKLSTLSPKAPPRNNFSDVPSVSRPRDRPPYKWILRFICLTSILLDRVYNTGRVKDHNGCKCKFSLHTPHFRHIQFSVKKNNTGHQQCKTGSFTLASYVKIPFFRGFPQTDKSWNYFMCKIYNGNIRVVVTLKKSRKITFHPFITS